MGLLGNPGLCGSDGLIQDHRGNFLKGFLSHYGLETNNGVKLRIILDGIHMCRDVGYAHVLVECDSSVVIGWLRQGHCSLWYLCDYCDELQEIM